MLNAVPNSRLDVHEAIMTGAFPHACLVHLASGLEPLDERQVVKALGKGLRGLRHGGETPCKPMPPGLASKAWLVAETLARAMEVFGRRERAVEWLGTPATGLNGQRPINMLQTIQGAGLVAEFLTRLDRGVYC